MAALPKPEVILTHESDLDGLISGLLLRRLAHTLFNLDVPIEAYHYQAWRQREMREGTAWVADFSFEERLDRTNWLIIDHHPLDVQPRRAHLIHDLHKSAGTLCYELCCEHGLASPTLDRLVALNNVSDLFLLEDPDFALANDYANLVKVYGFWNLHALIDDQLEMLLDHPLLEVMAVKRRIEDPLGLEWSRKNVIPISPAVGFVQTILGNTNLIVHEMLAREMTPYRTLVTVFRRSNGQYILSLRSREGEALAVAEKLQGGGHPNASGAVLPRSVRSVPDAVSYLRQVLNPAALQATPLNSLESLFDEIETRKG